MPDVVLVLGPVALSDFEIPEHIGFGGEQRLVVHKLPGGQRVIDVLGRDDRELTWSGIFSGSDATQRARLLDLLRVQGAVLPLTWDTFFYSVIISSFEAQYAKGWWIPYRISCTVVQDAAAPIIGGSPALATQVLMDLGSAASLITTTGIDMSVAQAAVTSPGSWSSDGIGAPQALVPVTGAQLAITSQLSQPN